MDLLTLAALALIVVPVVAVVVGVFFFVPGSGFRVTKDVPRYDVDYVFDPAESARFSGGGRVGSRSATWPLAVLEVDSNWVRLGGAIPTVWIPRDETIVVKQTTWILSSAVQFRTSTGSFDGVLFSAFHPLKLLAGLEKYGWPVAAQEHSS